MKRFSRIVLFAGLGAAMTLSARAGVLDRPAGIKIGQRMTLRPYVSFSATYDSNSRSSHGDQQGDVMWTVSPGLGLSYNAENWSLLLSGYYNYRQYSRNANKELNRHSYGQDLRWNWANSTGAEKGWSLILGESFQQVTAADDMMLGDRSYSSDTRQFQFTAALHRRFNEYWHANGNAGYYWLDYMNDTSQRTALYGWDRWTAGGEIGFAPSRWTDFLLTGNYQGFTHDNSEKSSIGEKSQGFSLHGGLGSYMTDRISYRLLAGWSRFEYGDGARISDGFTYTVSGNWKIGETWNTMLLATSYYHPSEQQYASSSRSDAFSWGLAKTLIRGKLRGTLDLRYRRVTNEYAGGGRGNYDYNIDVITGRLGLDYTLNRLLALFVYGEYQRSWNSESDSRSGAYDYDRWRLTAGFRVQY